MTIHESGGDVQHAEWFAWDESALRRSGGTATAPPPGHVAMVRARKIGELPTNMPTPKPPAQRGAIPRIDRVRVGRGGRTSRRSP
jgi:hypothetical protein